MSYRIQTVSRSTGSGGSLITNKVFLYRLRLTLVLVAVAGICGGCSASDEYESRERASAQKVVVKVLDALHNGNFEHVCANLTERAIVDLTTYSPQSCLSAAEEASRIFLAQRGLDKSLRHPVFDPPVDEPWTPPPLYEGAKYVWLRISFKTRYGFGLAKTDLLLQKIDGHWRLDDGLGDLLGMKVKSRSRNQPSASSLGA